jgi:small subunit ribosomal protein S16
MLVIRFKPTGRVNRKSYRISVNEKRSKLIGRSVDDIGYYNPSENPVKFKLDREKFDKWVSQGARVSKGLSEVLKKQTA